MVIHARSDIVAVNISEAHGGCGTPGGHRRPFERGVAAKTWALECAPCENHLRHDPHWSVTDVEVPLTYDEDKARERAEKSGKLDRENQLAAAIIELGKLGSLPEALGRLLAPALGSIAPLPLVGQMVCAGCNNSQPPGAKFCNECGQQMSLPTVKDAITAPPATPGGRPRSLREARKDELQALAQQRGVSDAGTRTDLINRLAAAGVTARDLAALSLVPA